MNLKEMAFHQAHIYLRQDICRRLSTCHLCEKPIVKGARRFVIFHMLTNPIQPANQKGKIFKRSWFFHPDCMGDWLKADDSRFSGLTNCFDCGIPLGFPMNHVYTGRHGTFKYLCEACIREPRWRYCNICQTYAARYETSQIIDEGYLVEKYACDRCADETDDVLLTVKIRKRLRREERARDQGAVR